MQHIEEFQVVMKLSDEEITARALSDPDAQPLTDEQLKTAVCLSDLPGDTFHERLQNFKKLRLQKTVGKGSKD